MHEAAFPAAPTAIETPPGDIAADIHAMIAAARDVFTSPLVRAALPGLIADMAGDVDHLFGGGRQDGWLNRRDAPVVNRDIHHAVDARRRADDSPAFEQHVKLRSDVHREISDRGAASVHARAQQCEVYVAIFQSSKNDVAAARVSRSKFIGQRRRHPPRRERREGGPSAQ